MAITQGGYGFDPSKLNDQELNESLNFYRTGAARDNPNNPTSKITLDLISRVEQELNARNAAKAQSDQKAELERLLGGGDTAVPGGASDFEARQRGALDEIFRTGQEQGTRTIDDVFANRRGQAIDEAAATGNLRQPGFLTKTLGDIDTLKANAVKDLFLSLQGDRARGSMGIESDLVGQRERQQQFGIQKAGLFTGANQFGQSFGLEKDKFSEAKRRSALDDIFNERTLNSAQELGRRQADDSQSGMGSDIFGGAVGGASVGSKFGPWGALIGGVGGAAMGGATSKKKRF